MSNEFKIQNWVKAQHTIGGEAVVNIRMVQNGVGAVYGPGETLLSGEIRRNGFLVSCSWAPTTGDPVHQFADRPQDALDATSIIPWQPHQGSQAASVSPNLNPAVKTSPRASQRDLMAASGTTYKAGDKVQMWFADQWRLAVVERETPHDQGTTRIRILGNVEHLLAFQSDLRPFVAAPSPAAPRCDCGGWVAGSHSVWCSCPADNAKRKKGLL